MAKTQAEIQKQYRERRKAREGDAYAKAERDRVKRYYVPSHKLSPSDRKERNEKKKLAMRRHRQRKKTVNERNDVTAGPSSDQSRSVSAQSSSSEPLVVAFSFPNRSKGGKARKKSIISKQRKEIRQVKAESDRWFHKFKALKRKTDRAEKKKQPRDQTPKKKSRRENFLRDKTVDLTPKRKAMRDLQTSGISPKAAPEVLKNLTAFYAMTENIKEKSDEKKLKSKKSIERIVSGKIIKKYRLVGKVSSETGLNRNRLAKLEEMVLNDEQKTRLKEQRSILQERVLQFMERDDNSRVVPDKGQVIQDNGESKAKRVLNDYLHHLHDKFTLENPDVKISLTTFQRFRPKYILPVCFTTKSTCLCIKHQNFVLKLKVFLPRRRADNADQYVREHTDDEISDMINEDVEDGTVKYETWKHVLVGPENEKKKKMRVVQLEVTKEEFKTIMMNDVADFRIHLDLISNQYKQIRSLKENLPHDHAAIQMDFAENYLCGAAAAVQSEFWNKAFVTLHPCVIYYREGQSGSLKHKSVVFVSDELAHNCGTVFSFLKRLHPILKMLVPDLTFVHYISDSPTSQYRNKHIFYIMSHHPELFDGIDCSWSYFEAGHGKGPCDGVGAVAKKMADDAVKLEKKTIQDAQSFFEWASKEEKSIKYVLVEKEECEAARDTLYSLVIKPVKGTFQIHAVCNIQDAPGAIIVRKSSCFCDSCFIVKDNSKVMMPSCLGWEKVVLDVHQVPELPTSPESTSSPQASSTNQEQNIIPLPAVDEYVAAVYEFDKKWYIGKVLEVDPVDKEINVSFMKQCGGKQAVFKWPDTKDEVFVFQKDILCIITPPRPSGKRARMYTVPQDELDKIKSSFEEYKSTVTFN